MKVAQNETGLLKALAQNDRKAVEAIYREHYNIIQALVVNNNGTPDDAKDVFQDAMVILFQKTRTSGFELSCSIRTYLYAISRRLWLKKLAQQSRFTVIPESGEEVPDLSEDLDSADEGAQQFQNMETALAHLGEPCKTLLEAFYFKKKSMGEIAALLGYTNADNAKTQKYKCLMRLKKLFFAQVKTGS